jgi:L-amino acid N-acyltransferase YncA
MTTEEFTFKDATLDELPAIVNIYNSTVASRMVTADTQEVTVESRVKWFDDHNPHNRPLWIIQQKNSADILGWVSFQSFYGRPAYNFTAEISIYLHPSARGKGLGKIVLEHSIERAKSFGLKTLLGYIFAHNEPSLKLFRNAGFEDWGYFPNIAVLDNIERGVRILGKRIA